MDDRLFSTVAILFVAGVIIWKFVLKPLHAFYKVMFPDIDRQAIKTHEEMEEIRKIQLFNISDINREYDALGMIEAFGIDKTQAKEKLQLKALDLGANAVINVTTNIDNNVKGSVGSVASMPRVVSGSTSTVTTYHYEGTAVKLLTKA